MSASANTVGGVPVGREDDAAAAAAATADVVVVKLKQPLSPAKKQPKKKQDRECEMSKWHFISQCSFFCIKTRNFTCCHAEIKCFSMKYIEYFRYNK